MSDMMSRVMTLANLLVKQQAETKALEDALKDAKARLRSLEREDLPALMAEIGLTELKLADGSVVSIKEEVDAGLSEERRPAALRWLLDNGFGGLIKTEITVAFERGQHDEAEKLAAELGLTVPNLNLTETVHSATLKSFVKEQLREGHAIPMDLFGVFPYSIAKVQLKKGK